MKLEKVMQWISVSDASIVWVSPSFQKQLSHLFIIIRHTVRFTLRGELESVRG